MREWVKLPGTAGTVRRAAALAGVLAALAPASALAAVLPSATSLHFQRLHQPDSPFLDPLPPDGEYGNPGAGSGGPAARVVAREGRSVDPAAVRARLRAVYDLLAPPGDAAPAAEGREAVTGQSVSESASGPAVKGQKDRAAALAERLALPDRARTARIEPPPGFVAVDLHVHTRFSPDSTADPEAMLRAAARRGLAGIAITDHNTVKGAQYTRAVAAQLQARGELPASFQVIEGEEVGSREGHIVGLFLHATVPPGLSAAETIAAIHAQGGLAIAAHPCLRSGVGALATSLPFDAVETENIAEELHFSLGSASANGRRAAFYRSVTAPQVGSSDAHEPSVIGLGYTLVPSASLDEASLRLALAAHETRVGILPPARHLRRVAESTARPAAAAFRGFHRLLAPGNRALRGMTRADWASLGPNVAHGRLGWALRITKKL